MTVKLDPRAAEHAPVLAGHVEWTRGGPPDPALWTARVVGGRVAEWRLWHDTTASRAALGF
jgi:hypothetical protein